MQACMDACNECHVTCLHMAMNHCLEASGKHADPRHMKIMMDCAQICVVAYESKLGGAARLARSDGENAGGWALRAGIRAWF